jgi:hypothetical protein
MKKEDSADIELKRWQRRYLCFFEYFLAANPVQVAPTAICQQSIESRRHGTGRLVCIGALQPQINSELDVSELVVESSNRLAIWLLSIFVQMKGLGIA